MSDAAFLDRVSLADEHSSLVLALRDAVAAQCGIASETVYDTDRCDSLLDKLTLTGGWDSTEFILFLEDRLGIKIEDRVAEKMPIPGGSGTTWLPTLFGRRKDCDTVAGWIRVVVPYIQERMTGPRQQEG